MDIPGLIQSYGYLAVAVGTFLEGESVLLTAGAAAFHGYLWMPAIILIATLSGFLGDQISFYAGRKYGNRLLARFPALQLRATRVSALLERHNVSFILAVRFMYGLRVAGPMVMGMSNIHWSRFLILNLTGAVIWAITIASIGYGLGQGFVYLLRFLDAKEVWLLIALLLPAIIWRFVVRRKYSARSKHS
ncbi:DedA family protein [Betaproteobacteria bacterium PRO4]|nr:DedA family protein [Betaproteobacteria bacterium PRO4]